MAWELHEKVLGMYCERTGPEFWAEPVNALTNLAFIAAAVAGWAGWSAGSGSRDRGGGVLIALTAAIGAGSFLFHTVASRWAMLADVLPILVYMLTAFALIGRRVAGWSRGAVAGFLVLFVVSMPMTARVITAPWWNGSQAYLPAAGALLLMAGVAARRDPGAARVLAGCAGIFAVSLFFRSVDRAWCAWTPFGTHFLWHLLNGWLLARINGVVLRRRLPLGRG